MKRDYPVCTPNRPQRETASFLRPVCGF
jgi:hypothetical protein